MPSLRAAVIACLVLLAGGAGAQQADDLDRIPQDAAMAQADPSGGPFESHFYVQDDFSGNAIRGNLTVPLTSVPEQWEERVFADARLRWQPSDALSLQYSGRLNLRANNQVDFGGSQTVRLDLREILGEWTVDDATFVRIGRINLKSGAALGYNPTDFFKTRAVVEPLSADPSDLREDRLGTFMVSVQHVWANSSFLVAVAPRLTRDTPLYSNTNLPSLDPMFDRTNAHTRVLAKATLGLVDEIAPELLFYWEGGQARWGMNVTHALGRSIVLYAEWAGGQRRSLIGDAWDYGQVTGTLPAGVAPPLPADSLRHFRNDLAAGLSYATALGITFNLEYDFHQSGFSGADWNNWFQVGSMPGNPGYVAQELWYIRGYAGERQEPAGQHGIFLRADWRDAVVKNLNLAGFVLSDARDGSGLAQISADYFLTPQWTVGALGDMTFGGRNSDFGSLQQGAKALLRITYYP